MIEDQPTRTRTPDRDWHMWYARLSQKTLEQIGQQFGISRERVRHKIYKHGRRLGQMIVRTRGRYHVIAINRSRGAGSPLHYRDHRV